MRVLVLGGSVFLSRTVAAEALRRGHSVTCANRGRSGSVPEGASVVVWDRSAPVPAELSDAASFDAVVDVGGHPSRTRSAVAVFPDAHWVFVSTISVYADESTPAGRPGTLPLLSPQHEDIDLAADISAYGPMKVACEEIIREAAASATIIRPGLIVGPGDPSGRFTYWPARLACGGRVLAPGRPEDSIQVIDVRDLASWIVDSAESRLAGDYDGIGSVTTMGDLLAAVAQGCGADVRLIWVPQEFLFDHGVQPWAGPDSVPLWLPRPEYDGMTAHDAAPSYDAGLVTRPITETARDTLMWVRAVPGGTITGIDRERETELLAAFDGGRAQL
jgi:2'-hydroxyisoflavone reductase